MSKCYNFKIKCKVDYSGYVFAESIVSASYLIANKQWDEITEDNIEIIDIVEVERDEKDRISIE